MILIEKRFHTITIDKKQLRYVSASLIISLIFPPEIFTYFIFTGDWQNTQLQDTVLQDMNFKKINAIKNINEKDDSNHLEIQNGFLISIQQPWI